MHDWNELSSDWKVVTAALALFAFLLALGLAIRIFCALARLTYCVLVPRHLRPTALHSGTSAPVSGSFSAKKSDLDLELEAETADEEEEEEEQTSRE